MTNPDDATAASTVVLPLAEACAVHAVPSPQGGPTGRIVQNTRPGPITG